MSSAAEIHERLVHPANAVTDPGINLKRNKPTAAPRSERPAPAPPTPPPTTTALLEQVNLDIERTEQRLQLLLLRREALRNTPAAENYRPPIRVDVIQQKVSAATGVSLANILSRRRTAEMVRARSIAMYLARTLTTRSLPEIGKLFNNLHHTTVLHACERIRHIKSYDAPLRTLIDELTAALRR